MTTYDAVRRGYGDDKPLASYAGLMGLYGAYAGGLALLARRRGLPERLPAKDIALVATATFKASRLLTRDKVTSPLRAPFTEFVEEADASEVNERPRGEGPRRAVGELLTCPFCISQWVATSLTAGMLFAPRATRAVASVLTAVAASDSLQWGSQALKNRAKR